MVVADGDTGPAVSARPGRLILTIYGLYAREHDGWLAIADMVRLMTQFGVNAQAVRSAIHRLKRRGLLIPRRVGGAAGYALSDVARRILDEGDSRIFGHRRATAADGWLLVVFSVPNSQRADRYLLRSNLIRLGFGTVAPGTWVAPQHLDVAVRQMLDRLGFDDYVQIFEANPLAKGDLAALVRSWWDLDSLQNLYAEFLERHVPIERAWESAVHSDAKAFTDYIEVLTAWRRLPYADPGLPLELLPQNWNGLRAAQLFANLHGWLADAAHRHAHFVISGLHTERSG